jgi:4-hydroxy-tetrahydrodipicolinate synthase
LQPFESIRDEPGEDNSISSANNVPVVKFGMELAGFYGGRVREPLVELPDRDKERVREYYERVRVDEASK